MSKRGYAPLERCRQGHLMSDTRVVTHDGRSRCSACVSSYNRNRPRLDSRSRRRYRLKTEYGITKADFDRMLLEQSNKCKICVSTDWGPRGPNVDHDHATGVVRGLLCIRCNVGLGVFLDSPKLLEAARAYLSI